MNVQTDIIDFRRNSVIWNRLSMDDKLEYERLRNIFFQNQNQNQSTKERRTISFSDEIKMLIQYICRNTYGIEERCIIVGICFVDSYALINTQHLKAITSHCKSSLNGNFQKCGYISIINKAKIKPCLLQVLPTLRHESSQLRHWTIRCAFDNVQTFFTLPNFHTQIGGLEKVDFFKKVPSIQEEYPVCKLPHSISTYQISNLSDYLADSLFQTTPSSNPSNSINQINSVSTTFVDKSDLSQGSLQKDTKANEDVSPDSFDYPEIPSSLSFDFIHYFDGDWTNFWTPINNDDFSHQQSH